MTNLLPVQALIDQLQGKVKSYKKQIEEAEEIAALNLAKFRKVAGALGDAEAVADANEPSITKVPVLGLGCRVNRLLFHPASVFGCLHITTDMLWVAVQPVVGSV